jgi:hypothetical protein
MKTDGTSNTEACTSRALERSTSYLCLTGLTGTRIKSFPPVMNDGREQETTLSLHDVPAGYYLLEVRTSDSVRHVPVIVAR